jgi:hypothetical protein
VKKWAAGEMDPLDQAVTDFPKRQVMVSASVSLRLLSGHVGLPPALSIPSQIELV